MMYYSRKLHSEIIQKSKSKKLRSVSESNSIYAKIGSEVENYQSLTGEKSAAQKVAMMDALMQKIGQKLK